MNRLFITGRLTWEPKFYEEKIGKEAALFFNIANDDKYKSDSDDEPLYVNCEVRGDDAVRLSKKLYKGVGVIVTGKLKAGKDNYGNLKMACLCDTVEITKHTKAHLEKFGLTEDEKVSYNDQGYTTDKDGFMHVDENDESLPFDL